MGFPSRWCDIALDFCGGDLDEALNYILLNGEALEQMTFNSDLEIATSTAEIEVLGASDDSPLGITPNGPEDPASVTGNPNPGPKVFELTLEVLAAFDQV
jgi:hypothetical protein